MSFFSFLKPAEHAVGNAVSKGSHDIFSFLGNSGSDGSVRQQLSKQAQANPKNQTLQRANQAPANTFNPARTAVHLGVDALQAAPRAGATIGKSIGDASNQALGLPKVTPFDPSTNGLTKAVLGNQPIKSAQDRIAGSEAKGLNPIAATIGTIGSIGLDASPLGFGKGAAKDAAEKALKDLAAAKTVEDVNKVKKGLPAVVQAKLTPEITKAVTQTTDPNVVHNLLIGGHNIAYPHDVNVLPPGKPEVPPPVPTPQEIAKPHLDAIDAKIKTQQQLVKLAATDKQAAKETTKLKQLINEKQGIHDQLAPKEPLDLSAPPQDLKDATVPIPKPSAPLEGEVLPAPAADPVANITSALKGLPAADGQSPVKGIGSYITENRANLSAARRERLGQATAQSEGLSGREKTISQLGALKGVIPKVDASSLQEHLQKTVHPDDVQALQDVIDKSPDLQGYDKINAKTAVLNLFDNGKVPTPSEWKKINKVLGSTDLEDTIGKTQQLYGKVAGGVRKVLGTPKALLSSFDLSGMGRQGMILGTRYPEEFAKSFKAQGKYLTSDKNYQAAMKARSESPNTDYYDKMGLALTGVKDFGRGEEAFPSSLAESKAAEKVLIGKGVEASNRAYTGALTEFRGNVADSIIKGLKDSGAIEHMSNKDWESLGRYINTASGRGKLKYTESAAQVLGDVLFSPRLWKSRLDTLNPKYYYDLKGPAKKLALQNAGSLAAVLTPILGLATLAGGHVETDARSSDFLKVKFGDTRVDLLGGLQQNLVFAWRELAGEKKSSTTGAVTKLGGGFGKPTRLTILGDLIANKEAPIPAEASRILTGKDRAGQPLTVKGELANSLVPLSAQETASEVKHYGAKGLATSIPGYLGAGQQTYGKQDVNISPKQKDYIAKLSDPKAQKAYTSFVQSAKLASASKSEVADQVKAALKAGNTSKAISLAKQYNSGYSDGFKDWRNQYAQYRGREDLVKFYNKGLITEDSFNRWSKDAKGGS